MERGAWRRPGPLPIVVIVVVIGVLVALVARRGHDAGPGAPARTAPNAPDEPRAPLAPAAAPADADAAGPAVAPDERRRPSRDPGPVALSLAVWRSFHDEPVPGADVVVIDADGGRHEASCGLDGEAVIRGLPPGPVAIEASRRGLRGRTTGLLRPWESGRMWVWVGEVVHVTGRVTHSVHGGPVPGAVVDPGLDDAVWDQESGAPVLPTRLAVPVDAQGRYSLWVARPRPLDPRVPWMEPGPAPVLVAMASGHTLVAATAPGPAAAGEAVTLDFVLDPAGTVRGHVRGPQGVPVAGAAVRLLPVRPPGRHAADADLPGHEGRLDGLLHAVTGDDGAFAVPWVPLDGAVHLVAEAPGWVQATPWTDKGPTAEQPDPSVEVPMVRAASLHLVLRTPTGLGVPHGTVHARSGAGALEVQVAADALGRVDLVGLAPGSWTVTAFAPELLAPGLQIDLAPGEEASRTLVAPHAGALSGVLRGADGAPQPAVRLRAMRDGLRVEPVTRTDAEGRFAFPLLAAGPWRLVPETDEGRALVRTPMSVRVPAHGVDVRTDPLGGLVLSFAVPEGTPPPRWVRVRERGLGDDVGSLLAHPAARDAERRWTYRFELPVGDVDLDVRIDGHAPTTCRAVLRAGEEVVVHLPLEVGGSVARRVLDVDGDPLADVLVGFVEPALAQVVRTAADGRFELRGLPLVDLVLSVEAPGRPRLQVAIGATAQERAERDIVVPLGARLHGRLLDAQGLPMAGRRIGTESLDEPGALWRDATATTDRAGSFHMHVLPGRYRLVTWNPDGSNISDLGPIDLRDDHTTHQDLKLARQ